jgi:hypothetical protein
MEVQSHFIVLTQSCGDSSLGVFCTGFVKLVFGQNQNLTGWGEFKGGAGAGNSSPEDKEINLELALSRHSPSMIALPLRACNKFNDPPAGSCCERGEVVSM